VFWLNECVEEKDGKEKFVVESREREREMEEEEEEEMRGSSRQGRR